MNFYRGLREMHERAAIKLGCGFVVPVVHIASMARCGETVLLRAFNRNSKIKVAHNLMEKDSALERRLFKFLKGRRQKHVFIYDKHVRHLNMARSDILLVKQGVWEHSFDFNGFVFVRNPVSVYASLKGYDSCGVDYWVKNKERLLRWMGDVDVSLQRNMHSLSPVEQFCLFYNRRIGHLSRLGKKIFHYENFVSSPRKSLMLMCDCIGIDYEDEMLISHEDYGEGVVGHGKNILSKAIDTASLDKYMKLVTEGEFDSIVSETRSVCEALGYEMDWGAISCPGLPSGCPQTNCALGD